MHKDFDYEIYENQGVCNRGSGSVCSLGSKKRPCFEWRNLFFFLSNFFWAALSFGLRYCIILKYILMLLHGQNSMHFTSDLFIFFTVDWKLIQHIKQIKWTGTLKADLFTVCCAPGRGPAALVVIHKHSPPKLGGGREGGKKMREDVEKRKKQSA